MIRRAGFTTRATCLLAAGCTAILCGIGFGEVDLVRAGILAVAVPCIASAVVHRSRVQIANRRRVEPALPQAGEPVTVHLTITNRSVLRTSALMLEDRLPEHVRGRARFVTDPLSPHEARPVSYRIPRLGRGRYRVGPLRMRLADPFGLVDLTRSFTATNDFVVTPTVEPLPASSLPRSDDLGDNGGSRSVGSHGADDQSTREYRTGDDLRKIHWKSSARIGALMVRQEERPWQGDSTLVLDSRAGAHVLAPPGIETGPDQRTASSYEWAVSAAASIGTLLAATGHRVALVGDGPANVRQQFANAPRLVTHLADVRTGPGADLGPLGVLLRTVSRESTLIAILGRLDPAGLRAVAQAHAHGRTSPAYAMVLDVDSWAEPIDADDVVRAAGERRRRELSVRTGVLRAAGWRVSIVARDATVAAAWQTLLTTHGGPVAPTDQLQVGR